MKKMSKWLKLIATGSISLLLSACYGVWVEEPQQRRSHWKLLTQSSDGDEIPGLKVSYKYSTSDTSGDFWMDLGHTDDSGNISFSLDILPNDNIYLLLEDVDGETNGLYDKKIVQLEDTTQVITLDAQ